MADERQPPEGAPEGSQPNSGQAEKEPFADQGPQPSRGEVAGQPQKPADEVVKPEAPPASPTPPKPASEAPPTTPSEKAPVAAKPPAEKPAAPAAKPPAEKPAAAHAAPKPPAPMAVTPWEGELPTMLRQRFGQEIRECSTYLGQNFLVARPESVIPIL